MAQAAGVHTSQAKHSLHLPGCGDIFWHQLPRPGLAHLPCIPCSTQACLALSHPLLPQVCRCLPGVDLTGQTSASFNMRLNYERCVLDFENYLACGQVRSFRSLRCAWPVGVCCVCGASLANGRRWGSVPVVG